MSSTQPVQLVGPFPTHSPSGRPLPENVVLRRRVDDILFAANALAGAVTDADRPAAVALANQVAELKATINPRPRPPVHTDVILPTGSTVTVVQ